MKTTDYNEGDVVILSDGKHYEYLGVKRIIGEDNYSYKPLEASDFFLLSDSGSGGRFAPFSSKLLAEMPVPPRKWYQKIGDWWKASNRWKHFLFAIPLGVVCGAPFTTGVGLGMEIKDHLYGNRADFVDFLLTTVGGAIGHGVMLAVGLDYLIRFLINLIF